MNWSWPGSRPAVPRRLVGASGRWDEEGGTIRAAANRDRWSVWFSYYLFIIFGIGLGATGVLLPAQMRDYGVDQATIGATFVANSVGFVVASAVVGPLGHRFGMRRMILAASVVLGGAYLLSASRPPLTVLVLASFVVGSASGSCEGVLNAYVAGLPSATAVMNRLHAYFGVGALLGPLAAAGLLTVADWPAVMLIMAGLALPPAAVGWLTFPARDVDPLLVAHPGAIVASQTAGVDGVAPVAMSRSGRHALLAVVRQPLVLWAGAMLCVYVGLEQGIGNWGYTYLVDARSVSGLLAGYTASGYWFGLTVGRFMATPATTRLRLSATQLLSVCMVGTTVSCALLWAAPATAGLASLSFVPLGFFLGPVYPTTMSIMNRLTDAHLVPTAIGALGAGGVAGGALFPWLMGTVIQLVGPWTLPPVALLLAVLQYALWRVLGRRLAGSGRPGGASTAVGLPNGTIGRFVPNPARD
ncbi:MULTISPECIES: MFS transporter [unclassified Frankia]|uniref:MFS transporter n=1 Tax=unclassified Frankia TaxID=2632575 RepID=UPI0027DEA564|nr:MULTISPECIES: MFS transporter [unclassified Frankia]